MTVTDRDREMIFKWLKKKSVEDWELNSKEEGDSWEEWVFTSIEELNKGIDSLKLFGDEVYFLIEWFGVFSEIKIHKLLVEFYNFELKKICDGE